MRASVETALRFDDSLQTVLAADSTTPVGATLAWRQLVDLIGRGRAPADDATLDRLRALRREVPRDVRAASGRSLAFAAPPGGLVRLFVEDEPAIAAPVLRTATLAAGEWNPLLAGLSPGARSILRHRRDLPQETVQALQAFGPVDFVLPEPAASPMEQSGLPPAEAARPLEVQAPEEDFVTVGTVARSLPALAALRQAPVEADEPEVVADAVASDGPAPEPAPPASSVHIVPHDAAPAERFEISELVARIDAFQRGERTMPAARQAELFDLSAPRSRHFRFESDADGTIRWVEGTERGPLIGLTLARPAPLGQAGVDGAVAGAFRRRAAFADSRLVVTGTSAAAGQWRITATPAFDTASGRFTGHRGSARRPRRDEVAEAGVSAPPARSAESMRQLVHELRTPLNAIAGFAQMIEAELLGPVNPDYRDQAATIRGQADLLLSGIDDLDMAARAESGTLELRPEPVAIRPLLERVAAELRPLADLRGSTVALDVEEELVALVDQPAAERIAGRVLATLVGAAGRGETVGIRAGRENGQAVIRCDRPALSGGGDPDRLAEQDRPEDAAPGGLLLGADFALRLAARLADEQGGSLVVAGDVLTLRLPAVVVPVMEQASIR